MSNINSQLKKSALIALLVCALHLFVLTFAETIFDRITQNGSQFQWELFCAGMNIVIAALGLLLLRVNCPEVLATAKAKLAHTRREVFLGFSGARRLMIVSALCIVMMGVAGLILPLQQKLTGVAPVEFAPTSDYQNPFSTVAQESRTEPLVKKFVARAAAAFSEEFIYRSFLFAILLFFMSGAQTVAWSAAIFGASHFVSRLHYPSFAEILILVPHAIVSGAGFGFAYLRVGFWLAFVLHLSFNCISAFREQDLSTYILAVWLFFVFVLSPMILAEAGIKKIRQRRE